MTETIETLELGEVVENTSMFHSDDIHPIESCEAVVAGEIAEVSEHPTNFEGVAGDLVGCYQKDTDVNERPTIPLEGGKVVDPNLGIVDMNAAKSK